MVYNLVFFSAANLYASNTDPGIRDYIYVIFVGISFISFLCASTGHIYYRLQSSHTRRSSSHSRRFHGRQFGVREEGEGELTLTETTARERRDSMFRESVLDLNLSD